MMSNLIDADESSFNHTKTWHSIGLTCFMASESFYGKYVWNTKVFDSRHPYKEMESIWEFHTLHHTYFVHVGIKGKMVLFCIYLKIRYSVTVAGVLLRWNTTLCLCSILFSTFFVFVRKNIFFWISKWNLIWSNNGPVSCCSLGKL